MIHAHHDHIRSSLMFYFRADEVSETLSAVILCFMKRKMQKRVKEQMFQRQNATCRLDCRH